MPQLDRTRHCSGSRELYLQNMGITLEQVSLNANRGSVIANSGRDLRVVFKYVNSGWAWAFMDPKFQRGRSYLVSNKPLINKLTAGQSKLQIADFQTLCAIYNATYKIRRVSVERMGLLNSTCADL